MPLLVSITDLVSFILVIVDPSGKTSLVSSYLREPLGPCLDSYFEYVVLSDGAPVVLRGASGLY